MDRFQVKAQGSSPEAVNVLTNGLHSSDEKIAVASAIHILKTIGIYGEVKDSFGPTTPKRRYGIREQRKTSDLHSIKAGFFCEWSVRDRTEELAKEYAEKMMEI